MSESPITSNKPSPKRSTLMVAAIMAIVLISTCALCAIPLGIEVGNLLKNVFSQSDNSPGISDFLNGEMTNLLTDLNADDRVTDAELNLEWYADSETDGGWYLTVDVATELTCTSGASDPCVKLVDDIARMALEDYRKANQLTGMTVSITQTTTVGTVDYSETPLAKSLSIPNWRKALGIKDNAVSP
jgi:hypothetical protein